MAKPGPPSAQRTRFGLYGGGAQRYGDLSKVPFVPPLGPRTRFALFGGGAQRYGSLVKKPFVPPVVFPVVGGDDAWKRREEELERRAEEKLAVRREIERVLDGPEPPPPDLLEVLDEFVQPQGVDFEALEANAQALEEVRRQIAFTRILAEMVDEDDAIALLMLDS